ncbi:MAG: peptidase T [Promethearchaeota archaeon]
MTDIISNGNVEVVKRFLKYVKIHTTSKEGVDKFPSTDIQFDLGKLLVQEIQEMGFDQVELTKNCVVMATIPSNLPEELRGKIPIVCLNAHMDTSNGAPGENVKPEIITFTGEPIILSKNPDLTISMEEIPDLKRFINKKLIVTDGTTLLGADDKAGIAEIMTALGHLAAHPEIKHGVLKIVFTPDEEVGRGAESIDVKDIGAKFAYTVDGGKMGGMEIENFNAAMGRITVTGYNVHPGSAFGKMKNSIRLLADLIEIFPPEQAPETTQDYEAYYHPMFANGTIDKTSIAFLLRNFDEKDLDNQIAHIEESVKVVQEKYPDFPIAVELKKSYRNMKIILDEHPEVVEFAEEAIKRAGLEVIREPIRGGTDGARFSFDGMPTPNIFTGGYNFHSKKEFIPIFAMEKAVEVIINLVQVIVEKNQ